MIRVTNLVKRFASRSVLRALDFQVRAGECVVLLGPNGAGKTTLLRVLAALSRPSSGQVEVAGCQLPEKAAELRRKVGLSLHQPLLYGELSAEENLIFYGRMYGLDDLPRRVGEMLELFALSAWRGELVSTFSRGMQQRLAIARALLHQPPLLLLDEPFTGLDQDARLVLDEVIQQRLHNGSTVLMTSHDLAYSGTAATRFDVISGGRIAASARREELPKAGLLLFYQQALMGGSRE